MRSRAFFAAAALVCAFAAAGPAAVRAAEDTYPEEDDVIVLDDDNFDDAITDFETLLVEFYAPWCGHCKALAPEYAKAAKMLKEDGLNIAKLDATANKKTGQKYDIKGFPTLKFFRNGNAVEYDGDRTAKGIANWVRRRAGPPAKEISSVDELDAQKAENDVTFVGVFKKLSSRAAKQFIKVAEEKTDATFLITDSAEVGKHLEAGKGDRVLALKEFETEKSTRAFEGKIKAKALGEWVDLQSLPVVIPFSNDLAGRIFKGHISTHFLLFIDEDAEGSDEILANYHKVAEEREGEALFITVSPSNDRILGFFEITEDELPTAVLVSMPEGSSMKKYRFEDEFSADSIKAFLDAFQAGNLKPFLKSEDVPADGEDYDGNVKIVVGKSFEDVALDASKDVMLEFYAPWCGHCKALAPEYEKAASQLSSASNVVVAKIDATANEVDYPGVNVQGFPTLYFFPAGEDKTPISYDGGRKAKDIVDFIAKNANSDVEVSGDDEDDGKDEL